MKSRIPVPLLTLTSKNFLADPMSVNSEPFQTTDISTQQPLGPTILEVLIVGFTNEPTITSRLSRSLKASIIYLDYMQRPDLGGPATYQRASKNGRVKEEALECVVPLHYQEQREINQKPKQKKMLYITVRIANHNVT